MNKLTRKLRDENNELEKQLSEEANAVLTDIVVYIRCANISEFNQERVRRDIDEMLLEGERRGQSVDDIIGGDYKTFCDSVISEVPQLTAAQKTMTVVSYAVMAIGIMLAIWTVFAPIRGLTQGGVWYMVNIGTVDIIEGVAVIAASFYIVDYICKNSFKPKKTLFFCRTCGDYCRLCCGACFHSEGHFAENEHRRERSGACGACRRVLCTQRQACVSRLWNVIM